MDFENLIQRFEEAIVQKNQKKIDILCNIYLASSFTNPVIQMQYEKIEELINKIKEYSELSKVSMTMVKISLLGKMI